MIRSGDRLHAQRPGAWAPGPCRCRAGPSSGRSSPRNSFLPATNMGAPEIPSVRPSSVAASQTRPTASLAARSWGKIENAARHLPGLVQACGIVALASACVVFLEPAPIGDTDMFGARALLRPENGDAIGGIQVLQRIGGSGATRNTMHCGALPEVPPYASKLQRLAARQIVHLGHDRADRERRPADTPPDRSASRDSRITDRYEDMPPTENRQSMVWLTMC